MNNLKYGIAGVVKKRNGNKILEFDLKSVSIVGIQIKTENK